MSSQVLAHFDPNMEIHLACDTSEYGIGAVWFHEYPDGMEKPVAFVSRTLNEAEKSIHRLRRKVWSVWWA